MKVVIRLVLLALGVGLFAWFVVQAGPGEVLGAFKALGGRAPLAVLPYVGVYLFDTLGWRFAFSGAASLPSHLRLFRIRMAGECVNQVVPSAYLGGEPVKVYLLHKRGVPGGEGATGVVVAKSLMTLAQVTFIALGSLAALGAAPPGSSLRVGLAVVTAGSWSVAGLFFWAQRKGLFEGALKFLGLFGFKASEERRAELLRIDERIRHFYRTERRRFAASYFFHLLGWLIGTLEVWSVCWLLGHPISWSVALSIEALGTVAKGLGFFVPGSLGVQESGIAFLFHVFGLPAPLGVSFAILRRGREVFFAVLGGMFLYLEEAHLKGLSERVRAETAADL